MNAILDRATSSESLLLADLRGRTLNPLNRILQFFLSYVPCLAPHNWPATLSAHTWSLISIYKDPNSSNTAKAKAIELFKATFSLRLQQSKPDHQNSLSSLMEKYLLEECKSCNCSTALSTHLINDVTAKRSWTTTIVALGAIASAYLLIPLSSSHNIVRPTISRTIESKPLALILFPIGCVALSVFTALAISILQKDLTTLPLLQTEPPLGTEAWDTDSEEDSISSVIPDTRRRLYFSKKPIRNGLYQKNPYRTKKHQTEASLAILEKNNDFFIRVTRKREPRHPKIKKTGFFNPVQWIFK